MTMALLYLHLWVGVACMNTNVNDTCIDIVKVSGQIVLVCQVSRVTQEEFTLDTVLSYCTCTET